MDVSPASPIQPDGAVTMTVTFEIVPGREQRFEHALRDIRGEVSTAPGFLELQIIRPRLGGNDYQAILRFDRLSNLKRWEESPERDTWFSRIEELTERPPRIVKITGTMQERPLTLAVTSLTSFIQTTVSGIGLLLAATALAIIMANSPLSDAYERFWQAHLTIGVEGFGITESLRHWANDGLMALFFFMLGMEIKREVLVGELRLPRQAALPIAAALGGAVVPALCYVAVNLGGDGLSGWGVPMATDTAFSLGILTLLGSRVCPMLLVFLTAFAIVDDILAVMVIAVFYTDTISWGALAVAIALIGVLVVANWAGFRRWPVYAGLGVTVWLAVFQSGIHGTVAGVLVAMTVPARSWINPSVFLERSRELIDEFERARYIAPSILTNEPQQRATQALEELCEQVETPMTHLQHKLNGWVAFGILPLFAFANAGIPLASGFDDALTSPVMWGVVLGLVVGKRSALSSWHGWQCGMASPIDRLLLPGVISSASVCSAASVLRCHCSSRNWPSIPGPCPIRPESVF
jgi:NhaA family Na+:H+ antiporter